MEREKLGKIIDNLIEWLDNAANTKEIEQLTSALVPILGLYHDTKPPLLTVPPDTWISVEERLPGGSVDVLVRTRGTCVEGWCRTEVGDWHSHLVIGTLEEVTHWRPLPEPPDTERTVEERIAMGQRRSAVLPEPPGEG